MIDITMTSTLRPSVLKKTLDSFTKNLLFRDGFTWKDYRLIINVDPIGNFDYTQDDILEIAGRYFPEMIFNKPDECSFPFAFHWCWRQVTSDIMFNLEEDWELLYPLSIRKMVDIMEDKNIAHLRLSTFRSTELTCKNWTKFLYWNGRFFECPKDISGTIGWCGHPSMNQGWFAKEVMKHLKIEINPEKQIKWRNKPLWDVIGNCVYGSFQPKNSPASIKDIGREWMMKNGWKKAGKNREWFQTWDKIENTY